MSEVKRIDVDDTLPVHLRAVMAFVSGCPKFTFLSTAAHVSKVLPANSRRVNASRRQVIRADTESPSTPPKGPSPPANFKAPEPRRFYVEPEQTLDIVSGGLASLSRAWSGALIEGYRVRLEDGKVTETSASLPKTRPRLPLRLFEFEACPFCRKVREAVTMLDLDVLVFPCPKGGVVYREYVKEKGGQAMFPYLQDPNTGFKGYESADIVKYLYSTYGPQGGRVPFSISSTFTAAIASQLRGGKGRARVSRTVPAKKALELYGYEASPFSKVVRERLSELELAYMLYTTPRGSPTREKLKDLTGRIQTPYLIDPNTGISMFESAAIVKYLTDTYGPNAPGAVEKPDVEDVFLPPFNADVSETAEADSEPSLDPTQERDEVLEEYCDDNPEADECRVYED